MKFKLRLRGADSHFGYAWFFMPFPPKTGDVFRLNEKIWEIKSVIFNASAVEPKDHTPQDYENYLTELTVESFPII